MVDSEVGGDEMADKRRHRSRRQERRCFSPSQAQVRAAHFPVTGHFDPEDHPRPRHAEDRPESSGKGRHHEHSPHVDGRRCRPVSESFEERADGRRQPRSNLHCGSLPTPRSPEQMGTH